MRNDSLGFFWQDTGKERAALKRRSSEWGPMPRIPETGWRPPEFPNLSNAKIIGFDTETYDPELTEAGPGWSRGKGHIIGASLAVEDGTSWYFPMRHGIDENGKQRLPPEHAAMNMDPTQVARFLEHALNNKIPKTGANLVYDVGWLGEEGVTVDGPMFDIQYSEPLLDSETPRADLDYLSEKYLGEKKVTEDLYHWLAQWNSQKPNDRQRKWLYRTPPVLAGPYAEADAALPIRILTKQWAEMHARGVLEVYDIECRLIPLLVKMRQKGAPVNIDRAEEVYEDFGNRIVLLDEKLKSIAGHEVNPNASDSIAKAFDSCGLRHTTKEDKKTKKEVVSFDKKRLEGVDHDLARTILEWKALSKVRNTFIKSYIIDKHVNGRLHCSFHPLRGKDGGARSGRFSSSDPNLQNIPTRTQEGASVRSIFDGALFANRWRSFDYSSIEYRLLAHFAVGRLANQVRQIFKDDPTADYHKIVGDLIERVSGIKLERGPTKTINFGIIYGMSLPALATALGLERDAAKDLLKTYHESAPYAEATMEMCADEVDRTGMVRTILGRVSDFNSWGPKKGDRASMTYEAAARKYGMYNIERQHKHKALNRKLQGSAADVMKVAMVEAYEAGLFEPHACGIPGLTVHDELNWEDFGDLDNPAWIEVQRVMENALADRLDVPLLVDPGVGPTWREAH